MNAFSKKVMQSDGVVVLEGTTKTCTKCVAIQPVVDELIAKYPDAKFYKYDVEDTMDISHELNAKVAPQFHVFKDGDVQDSMSGAYPDRLKKMLMEVHGGQ